MLALWGASYAAPLPHLAGCRAVQVLVEPHLYGSKALPGSICSCHDGPQEDLLAVVAGRLCRVVVGARHHRAMRPASAGSSPIGVLLSCIVQDGANAIGMQLLQRGSDASLVLPWSGRGQGVKRHKFDWLSSQGGKLWVHAHSRDEPGRWAT